MQARPLDHLFDQSRQSVVAAEHRQASHDMQSQVSARDLTSALMRMMACAEVPASSVTEEREKWGAFFRTASLLPDVSLTITFFKKNAGLRTMLATFRGPLGLMPKYVCLWDLENEGFRAVNLDGIVKVTLETGTWLPS